MNDPIVPMPEAQLVPDSPSAAEGIEAALRHLHLAMACLDAADEVTAPPHVQMAIDLLESRNEAEGSSEPGIFRF